MLKEYTGPKFGPPHDGWHFVVHKDGSVKQVKAIGAFQATQKAGWSLSDVVEMRFIKCPRCSLRLDERHGSPRPAVKKKKGKSKSEEKEVLHSFVKDECYEAAD